MVVFSKEEAFSVADRIMKHDYIYDSLASKNAGYPIYSSTCDCNEWLSDLGNRLEVNTEDGKSVNIWIDDRHPLEKSGFHKNNLGIWVM